MKVRREKDALIEDIDFARRADADADGLDVAIGEGPDARLDRVDEFRVRARRLEILSRRLIDRPIKAGGHDRCLAHIDCDADHLNRLRSDAIHHPGPAKRLGGVEADFFNKAGLHKAGDRLVDGWRGNAERTDEFGAGCSAVSQQKFEDRTLVEPPKETWPRRKRLRRNLRQTARDRL